jgi:hypothetical protein
MLAEMVSYLDMRPEVGLAYCDCLFVDGNGNALNQTVAKEAWMPRYRPTKRWLKRLGDGEPETPIAPLLCSHAIAPSASLIRRSVYVQTPGWDEAFGQVFEDNDLFLHIGLHSRIHYVPRQLVRYRRHAGQSTVSTAHNSRQEAKLLARWAEKRDISSESRSMVTRALRFRHSRFEPLLGLVAAMRYFKQGRLLKAARFAAGAGRRYLPTCVTPIRL